MELVQVAQHVDDLDRAVAFYERLLGQKAAATFVPPGIAFFLLDGTRLLLDTAVAAGGIIYLAVDDVEFSVDELRTQGVTIETEPHVIFQHTDDTLGRQGTDERMAFIRDSEGNTVGLVSYSDSDPSS